MSTMNHVNPLPYIVTARTSTCMRGIDGLDDHGLAIVIDVVSLPQINDIRHDESSKRGDEK
jgi:hypothetical protein